jgi:hypothetical protein
MFLELHFISYYECKFVLSHRYYLNKEVHLVSERRLYNHFLEKLDLRYIIQLISAYLYLMGKKEN